MIQENQKEVNNISFDNSTKERTLEIFNDIIASSKENLKNDGELHPIAFILCFDIKEQKYQTFLVPMTFPDDNSKDLFAQMLRQIVNKLEESSNYKVVALITAMEAFMSTYNKDELPNKSLKDITGNNYIPPSKDPKRKEVLIFTLEEEFKTRNVTYEFMKTDDEEVVIKNEPYLDNVTPYDSNNIGRFSFIFTKGASSN